MKKKSSNTEKLSLTITSRTGDMVDEMVKYKGFLSRSEAIRYCIGIAYSNFRAGDGDSEVVTVDRRKTGRPNKTANEKKQEEKETKKDLCKELDGKVEGTACHYYTYSLRDRFKQEVPLVSLNDSHIENQYDPSRENIEDRQKKGKINYPMEE